MDAFHAGGVQVGDLGVLLDEVGVGVEGEHAHDAKAVHLAGEGQDLGAARLGQGEVAAVKGPLAVLPGVHLVVAATGEEEAQRPLGKRLLADQVHVGGILGNGVLVLLEDELFEHAALGIEDGGVKRGVHRDGHAVGGNKFGNRSSLSVGACCVLASFGSGRPSVCSASAALRAISAFCSAEGPVDVLPSEEDNKAQDQGNYKTEFAPSSPWNESRFG